MAAVTTTDSPRLTRAKELVVVGGGLLSETGATVRLVHANTIPRHCSSRDELRSDTVDGVSSETPTDYAVWARPGSTPAQRGAEGPAPSVAVPPNTAMAYPGPQSLPVPVEAATAAEIQPAPRRGGDRLVWGILAAAAIFAVAAIVLTAVKWTMSPREVTTTVTAGPPAYTAEEIAAAKKQACDASMRIDDPITDADRALVAIPDRSSPEAQAALANFQNVVMVETEYLKTQTTPAAPQAVRDAVKGYVDALLSQADAETRLLADGEVNIRARATRAAGGVLGQVCKE